MRRVTRTVTWGNVTVGTKGKPRAVRFHPTSQRERTQPGVSSHRTGHKHCPRLGDFYLDSIGTQVCKLKFQNLRVIIKVRHAPKQNYDLKLACVSGPLQYDLTNSDTLPLFSSPFIHFSTKLQNHLEAAHSSTENTQNTFHQHFLLGSKRLKQQKKDRFLWRIITQSGDKMGQTAPVRRVAKN